MGRRAQEIMSMMSLSKDSAYPDATPAVLLALEQVKAKCAATAGALAEKMGGEEETVAEVCVRNQIMLTPVLNGSYYIRKEVLGWDARV